MAITINWATKVISVPQADLTPLGGSRYELDVDVLRLALKSIEDSEEGMSQPDTHRRNAPVTLAGVTYAQTFEIINGYTVEFEDGAYAVVASGANHNIGDVQVVNQVSLIVGNSAGLIVVSGSVGSAPTAAEVAAAVLAAMNATPPSVDVQKMNGAEVIGTGTTGDAWRGVGVSP